MPAPIHRFGGHLGSSVSALLDGQLDADASARAWQHVASCGQCAQLVEHEGWVKRRLERYSRGPSPEEPPERLLGSLLSLDPTAVAWAETQQLEDASRMRRRMGLAALGVGSVSAAVLGLTALSGMSAGPDPGAPATSIRSRLTPTTAVVAPTSAVSGRPGWTVGHGGARAAHGRLTRDQR
jgi:anti-sigma factor RsiW